MPQSGNQPVFHAASTGILGVHSKFASYPYTVALYSYGCKFLQPYTAATVRMNSDEVLSSTDALLMKTVTENNCQQQMVHFRFGRIRLSDTCESALTCYNSAKLPETSKLNFQKGSVKVQKRIRIPLGEHK